MKDVIAKFDTKDVGPISEISIKWTKESEASIHELAITTGENASDDIGEYVDPIIVDNGEEIEQNIAIGKKVEVSGTTAGDKNNVNDRIPKQNGTVISSKVITQKKTHGFTSILEQKKNIL